MARLPRMVPLPLPQPEKLSGEGGKEDQGQESEGVYLSDRQSQGRLRYGDSEDLLVMAMVSTIVRMKKKMVVVLIADA